MDNVPVHEASSNGRHKQGKFKKIKMYSIGVGSAVVVVVVLLLAVFFFQSTTGSAIDSSKYQAVFLTNGQVYFGKMQPMNGGYMRLTDIYYLQTQSNSSSSSNSNLQSNDNQKSDVQLIKLGNEIHGPNDEMIISKDQILFFENLKKDGKVAESIAKYQSAK